MSYKFKFRITIYSGYLGRKSYKVLHEYTREYVSSCYACAAASRLSKKYSHLINTSTPVGYRVDML